MSPEEKRLLEIFSGLSTVDRGVIVAFAEYLHHRQQAVTPALVPLPLQSIARPATESVPAALKRLRLTYPMLDASELLAEASDLLSQHLMLGRAASEVIDEMEALFQHHYQRYSDNHMVT